MTHQIPRQSQETAWHALPAAAVTELLASRLGGLSDEEAAERLARHGPNLLPPPPRRGPLIRFLAQFHDVLIYALIAASLVTAMLAHWVDTAVILGVVLVNALIGFIQEGKAETALQGIRKMLPLRATVVRDGKRTSLDAEGLVPGDMVFVQSGDRVPADLRLVRVKNLRVQEASLTGESLPVEKAAEPVAKATDLGDRSSMAYSGTLVVHGQATGIAVATGQATEIGRISTMLSGVQTLTTPLLAQLARFGRWLTAGIAVVAAATFGFGILVRGLPAIDMFLATVGLAVAAIPEGLPAVMTITLAIGVLRMARRNAILRRLPAVETLGSVSVICSDKTGTLTRNEMTVQWIATSRHLYEVTGAGYQPDGAFLLDGETVSPADSPLLSEITRGALLCSDASLRGAEGQWTVEGDPMEGALIVVALKAGLDPVFESKALPRSDVIPFESEHRFMASLHHDHAGHGFIYVKGAPERIVEMCGRQRGHGGDEPLDRAYWHRRMEEISTRGQRLLALAFRPASDGARELRFDDVRENLTLVGLFGLADPPREEAIEAVRLCLAAGIRVKMITGDHAGTARAIAVQIGLANTAAVLTGRELDALDDPELERRAGETDVFARTTPQHKLRLVQALQASGEVVAMTGDGVNDAPALKRADIGVAMGLKGTDAAKEAAEMVLADDNFASIAHAVEEGRTVYDNLLKSITFILPTNGGEALTVLAAIGFGTLLPITAVQILWVNMITAVTLSLALAFEPGEANLMLRPPRPRETPILSRFVAWRIVFVSAILVAGTFGVFLWQRQQGAELELARTVAVNTLVMMEIFYLLSARFRFERSFSRQGLFGSRPVLIAIGLVVIFQLLFTYAPPMQLLFHTRAIDPASWLTIVAIGSLAFLLVEGEKLIQRRVWHAGKAGA